MSLTVRLNRLNVKVGSGRCRIFQSVERRGPQGVKGDSAAYLKNVIKYEIAEYRYMVGDSDNTGTNGKVNRWEISVGPAGSASWSGTKPSAVDVENLTYS